MQYWSGSTEKWQSYQASNQCWAIIGPPAKRHTSFCWRADYDPLLSGTPLPSTTKEKKNVTVGPPLNNRGRLSPRTVYTRLFEIGPEVFDKKIFQEWSLIFYKSEDHSCEGW